MPAAGYRKPGAKKRSIQQRAYNSSPEQKKRRAERNASRAKMIKAGKAKKGDGRDVDHRNKNTANKSASNLRMRSVSANRADNRGTGGRRKKR